MIHAIRIMPYPSFCGCETCRAKTRVFREIELVHIEQLTEIRLLAEHSATFDINNVLYNFLAPGIEGWRRHHGADGWHLLEELLDRHLIKD